MKKITFQTTLFVMFFSTCMAQVEKQQMLVGLINNILKENPSNDGGYCVLSIKNEKLVIKGYDGENRNWSMSEAYFSDLTQIAKSTNFSKIFLYCESGTKCVKGISTNAYNIQNMDDVNFKLVHTIDEVKMAPKYYNQMQIYFTPDSHVAQDIYDLLIGMIGS